MLDVPLADDAPATFQLTLDTRLTRSGHVMRLVQDNGATLTTAASPSLVRLVVKARRWWSILHKGEIGTAALAEREGIQPSYLTRVLRLAFLSPAVLDAILAGTLRHGVDGMSLVATGAIAPLWAEQKRAMLPSPAAGPE